MIDIPIQRMRLLKVCTLPLSNDISIRFQRWIQVEIKRAQVATYLVARD